jgi:hypothetical protein
MPETIKFMSDGMGNGFPFCLSKFDVTSYFDELSEEYRAYDYWTTLSGYNKDAEGAPTDKQIHDSHKLAMKLFWMVSKFNAPTEASKDTEFEYETTYDLSISSSDTSNLPDWQKPHDEPRTRVCMSSPSLLLPSVNDRDGSGGVLIWSNLELTRMYKGATTDEANFIGYGVNQYRGDYQGDSTAFYIRGSADGIATAGVRLYSAGREETYSSLVTERATGYVTISGMHFVADCFAYARNYTDYPGTRTVDVSTASAEAMSPLGYSASAKVSSLEFHPKPTN